MLKTLWADTYLRIILLKPKLYSDFSFIFYYYLRVSCFAKKDRMRVCPKLLVCAFDCKKRSWKICLSVIVSKMMLLHFYVDILRIMFLDWFSLNLLLFYFQDEWWKMMMMLLECFSRYVTISTQQREKGEIKCGALVWCAKNSYK